MGVPDIVMIFAIVALVVSAVLAFMDGKRLRDPMMWGVWAIGIILVLGRYS